ncbi:hypothetical protein ACH5RR_033671 [Cinchona calisaya]|uniref:Uncharacterized protein n=1 Tax=Cinchona calisaya TaxID=153742 RepID=A0ABD2YDB4_9GENT
MLRDLLREAFPEGVKLTKSNYEAKKVIKELGLGYEKYDAVAMIAHCIGEDPGRKDCETCKPTWWIVSDNDAIGEKRKIPHKVLWHFPLKPRLQRLSMSSKTASSMRWHAESRTKDSYLRHPADTLAWQYFDYQHLEFVKDPRDVRLGLASDGFNPFKNRLSLIVHGQ